MGPRNNYANIPPLKIKKREITDNDDKARALFESFFSKIAELVPEPAILTKEKIPWVPVTELKIEKVLRAAKGITVLKKDGLLTFV
jgi:hypothetical protein